jgi:hypothetical protein
MALRGSARAGEAALSPAARAGDAPGAAQAKLAATAMGGAAAIRAGWHAIGGIGDACARNPEG